MRVTGKSAERGVVLVIVLWGIVLLTLLAFALSTSVRTGVESIQSQQEQLQAHYLARGAVYQALARLVAPPTPSPTSGAPAAQAGLPSHLSWQANGWQANIQIDDEAGKVDLNHAPQEMLVLLFEALGLKSDSAAALADSTEEWRRPDLNPGFDDTEDAFYRSLPLPYVPPHADFQSVAEMLQVRGVTPDLYYGRYVVLSDGSIEHVPGLIDCLSVYSDTQSIDINSAPYPVLLAIPGVDASLARFIVEARQQKPFLSLNRLTQDYPGVIETKSFAFLTTQGNGRLSLLATVANPAGVTARVQALVELQPAKTPPFLVLRWDDNYVR